MSDKIMAKLNSGEFRRESREFKVALLDVAFAQGLIGYDHEHDVFVDMRNGSVLLGLLPDADGKWTVAD